MVYYCFTNIFQGFSIRQETPRSDSCLDSFASPEWSATSDLSDWSYCTPRDLGQQVMAASFFFGIPPAKTRGVFPMCSISILNDNWRLFLQGYGEVIFGIAPGSHSSFTNRVPAIMIFSEGKPDPLSRLWLAGIGVHKCSPYSSSSKSRLKIFTFGENHHVE